MKVIILDIDGVLNSNKWYGEKITLDLLEAEGDACEFDPEAVSILNRITDTTGAKIIVSSSWRNGNTEYLRKLFKEVGIKGEVLSETKNFHLLYNELPFFLPRGLEIKEHLSSVYGFPKYDWDIADPKTEIETYVILDDDADMLYEQRNNFIQTTWADGLTDELADKAIAILLK